MKEIESLIPHRKPFLFVDYVEISNDNEIIGYKTYDDSFEYFRAQLPDGKVVPATILVESLAQCGGAGLRKIYPGDNGTLVLGSIETAKFFAEVKEDQTVKMVVKNIRVGSKIIKQSGVSYVNNKPVVEATWICSKIIG